MAQHTSNLRPPPVVEQGGLNTRRIFAPSYSVARRAQHTSNHRTTPVVEQGGLNTRR